MPAKQESVNAFADTHSETNKIHQANTFVFKWYVPMVSISAPLVFFSFSRRRQTQNTLISMVRRGERRNSTSKMKERTNDRADERASEQESKMSNSFANDTQWRDNKTYNNGSTLCIKRAHFYDTSVCLCVCFFWIRNSNKDPKRVTAKSGKETTHCFLFIFCIKYRKQQQQNQTAICHKKCFSLALPSAKPYTH